MSSINFNTVHETPPYSTSPLLARFSCIEHGFFGARGGVSSGIYTSLNCGFSSHDDHKKVRKNRGRVAACFGLKEANLHSLKQAHTTEVVQLNPGCGAQFDTVADGMVCNVPGVGLGALGADCAPVLFVDPVEQVIGAAHSGWKGALNGINDAVVFNMQKLGARIEHIHAAIGPSMQQQYYEVQADFQALFDRVSPIEASAFFCKRQGNVYFDTSGYIRARLLALGVRHISTSSEDTYSAPAHYFSYRRSGVNGEPDYGRQIAVITLK